VRRGPQRGALALLWLLAGAGAAFAQQPAPPPPPPEQPAAEAAPAPIAPIPLPRVAEESEEVVRSARQLGEITEPVPEIEEIETALPGQAAQLEERERRAKSLARDPTSLVALEEELKTWELAREQLAASLGLLTTRLTDLEGALDELSRQRQVWKATEQAALEAVAPDPVVQRIREVQTTLRDAKRGIEQRRDQLLALQAQVAEEEKRARAALDSLVEARSSFRSLLLLRDSRPYWTAVLEGRSEVAPDLSETIGVRWRALVRFVEVRRERLFTHAMLLAASLLVMLTLRRRASVWRAEDARLEASAVIFERPISAAFLLAISMTPLLHPRAPRLADAITIFAIVIPVLRLLPRLLDPALVPAAYALSALAVLDRVRHVLEASALVERTVLLLEALAAFAFLAWMMRPERLAALPPGTRISRWLGRALRAAWLALGASAVANLFGWVHLARVLLEGVLGSSYLAVVLYGGARVMRTVLRALLRSSAAQRLGVVRRNSAALNAWIRRILHILAFGIWGYFTLGAFGVQDALFEWGRRVLTAEAKFGAVGVSLGDVLAFVLTLTGAWLVSRVIRTILEDDVVPRLPASRGVAYAITTTIHYTVLLVGFLLAISAAGVDLNRVSILAGAFGVGIGFGLQNVVNNFVSGLILLYERPVQLGDLVEVGGHSGEVRRIGIRSSTLRTAQGAEVIVPNSSLIAERVINWTFADRRRPLYVKVRVAGVDDPDRVRVLLEEVARAQEGVLKEPAPHVAFLGFGEGGSREFELRAWTGLPDRITETQSALGVAAAKALGEAGIEVRDLQVRSDTSGPRGPGL
jgi:potassium-dependent mechanosensitive channel